MMTAVRWFVLVIALLTAGLIVIPWYLRTHSEIPPPYQPKLFVTVDGKPAGRDIVLLAYNNETNEEVVIPCSKGRCRINFSAYDPKWTDTIQKLSKKLPTKAIHSTEARQQQYAQSAILWSIDATAALKKLDGDDYAITIDSNKRSAKQSELVAAAADTTEDQPVTLGLSNVDRNILQWIFLALVIGVVYFGYKMISVGGHSH